MAEPQDASAPRKTKTGSKVGIVFAILLVVGGLGIYHWTRPASLASAGASGAALYTVPLETFVVNLSGGERAYLRVGIAIGLSRLPARKEDVPVAMMRDTILSILSAAKPEELAAAEGKNKLKGEILQALQDRAPQLGVEDVYFTEFLVQM
jgi:flagellar protein FliL